MGKILVTMGDVRLADKDYRQNLTKQQLERQKAYDALLDNVFGEINAQLKKFLQKVAEEGLEKQQGQMIAYCELPQEDAQTFSVLSVIKDLNEAFEEEECGFIAEKGWKNNAIVIHIKNPESK